MEHQLIFHCDDIIGLTVDTVSIVPALYSAIVLCDILPTHVVNTHQHIHVHISRSILLHEVY